MLALVVSYLISTSNHNLGHIRKHLFELYLILFLHQTTTDNSLTIFLDRLYLILFLHQTTTNTICLNNGCCCILSYFYIKPQPSRRSSVCHARCILSYFYIKPQPCRSRDMYVRGCILSYFYIKPQLGITAVEPSKGCILSYFYIKPQHNRPYVHRFKVVSYLISTSNHN